MKMFLTNVHDEKSRGVGTERGSKVVIKSLFHTSYKHRTERHPRRAEPPLIKSDGSQVRNAIVKTPSPNLENHHPGILLYPYLLQKFL